MKNFIKKIFVVFMSTIMFFVVSCSNVSVNTTKDVSVDETKEVVSDNAVTTKPEIIYQIGTLQLVQHEALDSSNRGFFDYLDEKSVKYQNDYANASGEQSACQTIAEKFMNEDLDLIYAIATPAAQSINAVDETVPIVGCAITDFAASGLCDSNERPGGILTGASDMTPVNEQFDLMMELFPETKTVGILYCSAEANSKIQADMALDAAKKYNLDAKVYTVVSSADIQTVTETMVGQVDCIYIPTDNTVSASVSTVAAIANDNKIPTIVGEEGMLSGGCTATYGIDYYQLGRIAGEMAYEILVNGQDPATMSIRTLPKSGCVRKINKNAKELFGIDVD